MIAQWLARGAWPTFRIVRKTMGVVLVFSACAGTASARLTVNPEIDAGTASSALGLLVGGAYLLTDRLWRKK